MKKIKIALLVIAGFGLLVYLFFPWNLAERGFWQPAWWEKSLYNFCKYTTPENYKVISYAEGAPKQREDQYLITLKEQDTGQSIILSRLRGFHFVNFNQIKVDDKSFGESIRFEREHFSEDFKVITRLPVWHFLRQDDMSKIPANLLLQGITVEKKEVYSTDKAEVYYLKGSFRKIGFFKKMPFPWGFATPVFDFTAPSKGALAIMNSKKGEETIIAISSVPANKEFNEKTFKQFISSVTYDKDVYRPALLEGAQEAPKVKYNF